MSCKILLKCKWPSPKFSEVHFQVWWAFQEPTCPCVYHNQRPLYKWVLSKRSKVLLFRPLPVSLGHYEPLSLLAVILFLKWTLIFPPEVFCTCQSLCQCPIPSPSWAESLIEMPPSLWSLPLACPTLYGFGHWVFPPSHFSFLSKCSYLSSTSSLPCKVHESRYLTKRHEINMKVNKNTLKNVFRIFNHNTPKLEKVRYSSTEECMKKLGYTHLTR